MTEKGGLYVDRLLRDAMELGLSVDEVVTAFRMHQRPRPLP